jgi:hypothetical protein
MKIALLIFAGLFTTLSRVHAGIGDDALRRKIADLRNDRKEGNCGEAQNLLSKNVEDPRVQAALLRELYSTKDRQSRESCFVLLCQAKTFQPDEKFIRALLVRIRAWGRPYEPPCCEPAGDVGAIVLVRHAQNFADLIAAEIHGGFTTKDNSLWHQYVIIRTLAKAGIIERYADHFTPEYLRALAHNLQDDNVLRNAKLATAAFVFLGRIGLPVLKEVPRTSDLQGRELASAIIAYVSGTGELAKLERSGYEGVGLDGEEIEDLDSQTSGNEINLIEGPVPLKEQLQEEPSNHRPRPTH